MATPKTNIILTAEDRTAAAFASVKRGLGGVENAASTISGALGALGIGAGLSAAGLASFVKSGIDAADEMGKLSQRVGVGTEALSALNYAASLSDVSTESLATGLKKLAVNAADTAKGTGEARDAFAALGINVRDSSGSLKNADVLLAEVAGEFAKFEDGAAKTALAVKIFGKAGADLIPLLNGGADGLAKLREEAERLGVIISPEQAKAAEEFNDSITRLQKRLNGFAVQTSGPVLQYLEMLAKRFDAARSAGDGWWSAMDKALSNDRLSTRVQAISRDLDKALEDLARREAAAKNGQSQLGPLGQQFVDYRIESARDRVNSLRAELKKVTAEANSLVGVSRQVEAKKKDAPELIDSAAAEKMQASLAKAFSTKPLDDFLASFTQRSRAIEAEYRRLVSELTTTPVGEATGLDVQGEISKGRAALAGGDAVGFDIATERAKASLRSLRENGGTTDEINYYARQLQQLEQDALKAQQTVAETTLKIANQTSAQVLAQAEKLKFEVDATHLGNQIKDAIQQAMASIQDQRFVVPALARPSLPVTSTGAQSVAIQATKFGAR